MRVITSLLLFAALLVFVVQPAIRAQSGNIIFLGATSGTTLATNCPAAPTTPSVCVVGDGVWLWQSAATGWFKPAPAAAPVGVQKVNGVAPGATGNVTVNCPNAAPAVTVSGPTVSSTTTLSQLATPSVTVAAPANTCIATGS